MTERRVRPHNASLSSRAPRARRPGLARGLLRTVRRTLLVLVFGVVALPPAVVLVLRVVPPPTTAFIFTDTVTRWRAGYPTWRPHHDWVPWEQIAPVAALAVVASEDQNFPRHHGFDLEAIRKVLRDQDAGGPVRGASTISQQTAKNLFLWSGKTMVRKGVEAYCTLLLETLWPKRRILEVYLNIAQFGPGVYGVEAAAQRYFHKPARALTAADAALLATALPAPSRMRVAAPGNYMRRRQAWVLRQMNHLGPGYLAGI